MFKLTSKHKRFKLNLVIIIGLAIIISVSSFMLFQVFEGEKPFAEIYPVTEFFSNKNELNIKVSDAKRGIRSIKVLIVQGGRSILIFDKGFDFNGFLNHAGTKNYETSITLEPSVYNLAQGHVELLCEVRDFSRRNGGDGNLTVLRYNMIVDTVPPTVRMISRQHNVNQGGIGFIVYKVSSDAVNSGVVADRYFFKGYPLRPEENLMQCYFTIPLGEEVSENIYLWAIDKAGNSSQTGFYYRVQKKRFRERDINLSKNFIKEMLIKFGSDISNSDSENLEKFLKINRDIRKINNDYFKELAIKTSPERLWDGEAFISLPNSANMAQFGDVRYYRYNGERIDVQTHMGLDLASLAHSDVPAANSGQVIFADDLGIYGLTVVIDHGLGIATSYSHLSSVSVGEGHLVNKGDNIGTTGETGWALGDHLHYGVMVNGFFVNPIEFLDPHWIKDNITRKLTATE